MPDTNSQTVEAKATVAINNLRAAAQDNGNSEVTALLDAAQDAARDRMLQTDLGKIIYKLGMFYCGIIRTISRVLNRGLY